jgi:hypothetical protein
VSSIGAVGVVAMNSGFLELGDEGAATGMAEMVARGRRPLAIGCGGAGLGMAGGGDVGSTP